MQEKQYQVVALIPARSGSKRVTDKNIRQISGHPLIAYTIVAALQSKIFASVIVSTDSEYYAEIAEYYGAEVPFLRPREFAGEHSPDFQWIEYTLKKLCADGQQFDCFSILRPTSPFRQSSTLRRAWEAFINEKGVDSLRAVEKCKQHPGKMWVVRGNRALPLMPLSPSEQPWHSSQYQSLPEVYVQNASLEIAWTHVVMQGKTIAGNVIVPFFTNADEGFDINDEYDWKLAEHLVTANPTILPEITCLPFQSNK